MNLHANHRTCPSSRRLICRRVLEHGWSLAQAAEAAGCSPAPRPSGCAASVTVTMSYSTAPRALGAAPRALRTNGFKRSSACAACA